MDSLSGFRPPQFSESDAWLPVWLQQCDVGELNIESVGEDYMTFKQRIEEFKFEGTSNRESMRDEGGYNVGQLFISGIDSSPFSVAQSADNVVQLHLRLSSDGYSDNTTLTADANQTESTCPLVIQALQSSPVLAQKDANLSSQNFGMVDWSQTVVSEKSLKDKEFFRHDKSVNFCEDAANAVELCIAASEALVINKAIESDPFAKLSASGILEASLQVKQARLAFLTSISSGTIDEVREMDNLLDLDDNLSDLDDLTMGSAYEDAGVYLNKSPGNKLSVSQVNDTFNSECDEKLNHQMTRVSAMACGICDDNRETQILRGVIDNEIGSRNNLAGECFDLDIRSNAIGNSKCYSGSDVGYHYDCFRTIDNQCLSVSTRIIAKDKPHETDVNSSPIASHQAGETYNIAENIAQERFQSRWLGGWTSNKEQQNNTATHNIPKPFVGETSFLTESADVGQDENSIVQNFDKGAIIASQLSISSEDMPNRAMTGILLSQDVVRSSSTSLVDPLCSVVPCSMSENACSSPTRNYEDTVCPGHFNVTVEHEEDNVLEIAFLHNAAAEEERIDQPLAKIMESGGESSRPCVSLRNYTKLLPSGTKSFKRDGYQKKPFLIHNNTEVTFLGMPFTNQEGTARDVSEVPILQTVNGATESHVVKNGIQHHFHASDCSMQQLGEENADQTALAKSRVNFLTSQNLQHPLLQSKHHENLLAPKHVKFLAKEAGIVDNKKLHEVHTLSKTGCSTRATKKSTRVSAHLESKVQQMDRFLQGSSNNRKKRLIFQNMEFLLTGFSQRKEKEIEGLIRKYGGVVLSHVPPKKGKRSSWFKHWVPIVLCLKKTQSLKFLYGCAVNAFVLNVNWLIDSISEGFVLPPKRYTILHKNTSKKDDQVYTTHYSTRSLVFNNLGVMIHGKTRYFSNLATIIEHGGGQVFKTFQRLIQALEAGRVSMGVVIANEESCASRHLKQCALEHNIPMTSVYWIIKSLYAGKIIPLEERKSPQSPPVINLQMCRDPMELSQEI